MHERRKPLILIARGKQDRGKQRDETIMMALERETKGKQYLPVFSKYTCLSESKCAFHMKEKSEWWKKQDAHLVFARNKKLKSKLRKVDRWKFNISAKNNLGKIVAIFWDRNREMLYMCYFVASIASHDHWPESFWHGHTQWKAECFIVHYQIGMIKSRSGKCSNVMKSVTWFRERRKITSGRKLRFTCSTTLLWKRKSD